MTRRLYAVGSDDLDAQIEAAMQEVREGAVNVLAKNLHLERHDVMSPAQAEAMAMAQERRATDLAGAYARLAGLFQQREDQ